MDQQLINKLVTKVAEHLIKKYSGFKFKNNGQVAYGENFVLIKGTRDLKKEIINPAIGESGCGELYSLDINKLQDLIIQSLNNNRLQEEKSKPKTQVQELIDHLKFVVDPTDFNKKAVLDIRTNTLSPYDPESLKVLLGDKKAIQFHPGILEFNPYKPNNYEQSVGLDNYPAYNLYNPPKWRDCLELTEDEIQQLQPPKIFTDFMEHLIPDEVCRDYVYDWMHFALTEKNNTYLVLNGAKGIGKNILSNDIMKDLVGERYHQIAPESSLESNFNSWLLNKRVIVMDEKRIDSVSSLNKVKRYINETQSVEKKGIDTDKTLVTYNSFIICNNSADDMRIEHDDRRFSVIDLTKDTLKSKWNNSMIERIANLKDDEIRALGYWLFYRVPKFDKDTPYRGKHFYNLCYNSVAEWGKSIIDLAMSGDYEILTKYDVRKEYRSRIHGSKLPKKQKIKDFLTNYLHNGEISIGQVVDTDESSDEEWEIIINKELIRSKSVDSDLVFQDIL
jgi:hypothetical protein